DPRDFVLVCTGGGGPLHAFYVARKIGVSTIVCPPSAGVASAFGLLVAPARADLSRTVSFRPDIDRLEDIEAAFLDLERQARQLLQPLDPTFGPITLQRQADGRFIGQGFNVNVTLPDGPYSTVDAEKGARIRQSLLEAFKKEYRHKFGRTPPDVPVQL